LRLVLDSTRAREHYASLHANFPGATVYQTLAWLDLWKHLGADIAFVEADKETMVPFVLRGHGALRRAYSLPFDTYGGPVTPHPNVHRMMFENAIEPLGNASVRLVDYRSDVASTNGAARNLTCHIVDLSRGYQAAAAGYQDSNARLIRQASERGVKVRVMNDEAASRRSTSSRCRTVALRCADSHAILRAVPTRSCRTAGYVYIAHRGDRRWRKSGAAVEGRVGLDVGLRRSPPAAARPTCSSIAPFRMKSRGSTGSTWAPARTSAWKRTLQAELRAKPFARTIHTHTVPLVGMARNMRASANRFSAVCACLQSLIPVSLSRGHTSVFAPALARDRKADVIRAPEVASRPTCSRSRIQRRSHLLAFRFDVPLKE
jgi:hypothetical protein